MLRKAIRVEVTPTVVIRLLKVIIDRELVVKVMIVTAPAVIVVTVRAALLVMVVTTAMDTAATITADLVACMEMEDIGIIMARGANMSYYLMTSVSVTACSDDPGTVTICAGFMVDHLIRTCDRCEYYSEADSI